MKTSFLRRRRERNAYLKHPTAYAIGGAFLALALLTLVLRLVAPDALVAVSTPLWKVGEGGSRLMGGALASFGNAATLTAERDQLRRENEALALENAALTAALTDLGRIPREVGQPAGVLARPPIAPYDTLVVDRGASDGVEVGALATGAGGAPLGRVESVAPQSARITLFSSPGVTTEAWVGEARLPLTLAGIGGGAFEASVSHDAAVAVGDLVYVAGPGALPLGTVRKVDTDPSSPRTILHIQSSVSPFSLTWVRL